MNTLPIACSLTPDELRARGADLLPGLASRAASVAPLPDGARLEFVTAPGLLADLAGVIERERACCRFLRFAVDMAPDEGRVLLDVTGPEGTPEFLATLAPEFARERFPASGHPTP